MRDGPGNRSGYSDGEGYDYAEWGAYPLAADGTLGESLVQPDPRRLYPNGRRSLEPGGHSADLASFFVRGTVSEADPRTGKWVERPIEVSWRWAPKAKAYVVKEGEEADLTGSETRRIDHPLLAWRAGVHEERRCPCPSLPGSSARPAPSCSRAACPPRTARRERRRPTASRG